MDSNLRWRRESIGSDVLCLYGDIIHHDAPVLLHVRSTVYAWAFHHGSVRGFGTITGTGSRSLQHRYLHQSFLPQIPSIRAKTCQAIDDRCHAVLPYIRFRRLLASISHDWAVHHHHGPLTTIPRFHIRRYVSVDKSLELDANQNSWHRSWNSEHGHCVHDYDVLVSSTVRNAGNDCADDRLISVYQTVLADTNHSQPSSKVSQAKRISSNVNDDRKVDY